VGNNKSLFDPAKWAESGTPTAASTTKLLTTIHPEVYRLIDIQETNSSKVKTIDAGTQNEISVPINIYFKMNSLDPTLTGNEYVNLNGNNIYTNHVKKVKFLIENEAENKPFIFTIEFVLKRARTILTTSAVDGGPTPRPAVVTTSQS
jgi:hypothetical protein